MLRPKVHAAALLAAALVICSCPSPAATSLLHEFSGGVGGSRPLAPLTMVNGVAFGVTSEGGSAGTGTIFRIDSSGNAFATLHDFDALADPAGQGSFPSGPLAHDGVQLLGVTEFGGSAFDGVVYRIGLDGAGYAPLHEFDMSTDAAVSPSGGVVVEGNDFFGTTLFGSATTEGTIYSIDASGGGLTVLHAFAGDGSEGEEIEGPLAVVGQQLWGVAAVGGSADGGTLYRLNSDGTGFSVRHDFGGSVGDGATPVGGLLSADNRLFGVTRDGGAAGEGTLYAINDDGTGYQTLLDFSTVVDGTTPAGRLTLVGDRLFGVTEAGGPSDLGTIYSIATDGSSYRLHHAFRGADGSLPQGGLTFDGTALYGATAEGGNGDAGVLFSLDPFAIDGDFNRDGVVDAADYTVWRDTLGSTSDLRADADFNGTIEQNDYDVWVANYGAVRQAPSSAAIPEPISFLLSIVALAISGARSPRA